MKTNSISLKRSASKSFKGWLFYLLKLQLWKGNEPAFLQYIFFIISEIQIIGIILFGQFKLLSTDYDDDLTQFLRQISRILSLQDIIISSNDEKLMTALNMVLYIFFLLTAIFFSYTFYKYLRFQKVSGLFQRFGLILFRIKLDFLVWVVGTCLLYNLAIEKETSKAILYSVSSTQLGMIAINVILLITSVVLSVGIAMTNYDPLKTNNPFCCRTISFQLIGLIFKIAVAPLVIVTEATPAKGWVFLIDISIILLIRYWMLNREYPFYHYRAMKIASIFNIVQLELALVSLLVFLTHSEDKLSSTTFMYVQAMMLPFFIKFANEMMKRTVLRYQRKETSHKSTENELFKKYFAVSSLVESGNLLLNSNEEKIASLDLLYLLSSVYRNQSTVEKMLMDLSKGDKRTLDMYTSSQGLTKLANLLSYTDLADSVLKGNSHEKIKIFLASEVFSKENNFHKAVGVLMSINKQKLNYRSRVAYSALRDHLEENIGHAYNNKLSGTINIKRLLDYEYSMNVLLERLQVIIKKYTDYWEYYKKPDFYIMNIVRQSIAIEKEANKISDLWKSFTAEYENLVFRLVPIFSTYLLHLRNAPYSAYKLIQRYGKTEELISGVDNIALGDHNLHDADNILFSVSMDKQKLGKIHYTSKNVKDVLGYDALELKDKNIKSIMYDTLQERHNEYWGNLLQNDHKLKTLHIMSAHTFTIHKNGCAIPCTSNVSLAPYINQELMYLGLVKPLKLRSNFLLINAEGKIEGMTMELAHRLGISPKKVINIKEILLNFKSIEESEELGTQKSNKFSYNSFNGGSLLLDTPQRSQKHFDKLFSANHSNGLIQLGNVEYPQTFLVALKFEKKFDKTLLTLELTQEGISLDEIKEDDQASIGRFSTNGFNYDIEDVPSEGVMKLDGSRIITTRNSQPHVIIPTSIEIASAIHFPSSPNHIDRSPLAISKIVTSPSKKRTGVYITHNSLGEFTKTQIGDDNLFTEFTMGFNEKFQQFNISSSYNSKDKYYKSKTNLHIEHLKDPNLAKSEKRKHAKLMENASVSSHSTNINKNNKIERSIYLIPKDFSLTVIFFFAFSFIVICVIMLFIFQNRAEHNINFLAANSDVLSALNLRLYQNLELMTIARGVSIVDQGLWPDSRLISFGVPSLKGLYLFTLIGDRATALINANMVFRQSLDDVELDLRQKIFSFKIPVVEHADDGLAARESDIFAIVDQLGDAALELNHTDITKWYYPTNTDLQFIYDNSLDGLVTSTEKINNLVIADIDDKLDSIFSLISAFFGILIFQGVIILILLCSAMRKFRKNRNHFIEIFLRMDEEVIDEHLQGVQQLGAMIRNEHVTINKIKHKKSKADQLNYRGKIVRPRGARLKGINKNQLGLFMLTIVWVALFLFAFLLLRIVTVGYNDRFLDSVEENDKVNVILYQYDLLIGGLWGYIASNGTRTIRYEPIGPELEKIYDQVTGSESYFIDLLEHDNSNMNELIKGDLCNTTLIPQVFPIEMCVQIAKGALTQGIIGLNNYATSVFRSLKDEFDYSDRSVASQIKVLNEPFLADMEVGVFVYLLVAYTALEKETRKGLVELTDEYQRAENSIILPFIFIYVIIGSLLLKKIWKNVEYERVKWRKMFRHIPTEMIHTNKALKTYLVNNSDHLLDSINF